MKLFGSSGIRAVVDKDLLHLINKVGLAVGSIYGNIVIGRDTRTSGDSVKSALLSGILAAGANAADGGIMPTPTLALAARDFNAGVMVTASHNPPEYNGIKLLNPDGSAFGIRQQVQIEEMVLDDQVQTTSWERMKASEAHDGAVRRHIERIRRDLPDEVNLKVVVDCASGAGSVITPYLLAEMGCEVISLNSHPTGMFPRDAEPTQANLGYLMKMTRELGADLGIAHDGDADRLMLVDSRGRFISGDKLLVTFARDLEAKKVVTTVDASMLIEEMGIDTIRTKVGDSYVSEELAGGGLFGGEPSGAWIFPEISLCPDGIYAAARAANIAARNNLAELIDEIPDFPIIRGSLKVDGITLSQLEQKLWSLRPLSVTNVDGLKLKFQHGWLLIRASGTEPKIRITAEAKTEDEVRQLYDRGFAAIRECMEAR
jgi:phosphoglucosamine mutase